MTGKPYREQGSKKFERSPILAERRAIRDSGKIRSAALQFWTAAGLNVKQKMPFDTYAHIHRRISQALAPELPLQLLAEIVDGTGERVYGAVDAPVWVAPIAGIAAISTVMAKMIAAAAFRCVLG